ncbi:MAG: hypothetical protein WCQ90_03465 [Deltaproteobacteria bacterium]
MGEIDAGLMNWLTSKLKEGKDKAAIERGEEPDFTAGYGGTVDGHYIGEDGILMTLDDGRRILLRVEEIWSDDEW